jgi:hypothetical protein
MELNNNLYKTEAVPIEFEHKGKKYKGEAKPIASGCRDNVCFELDVTLNNTYYGTITCERNLKWIIRNCADQELVNKIGNEILLWYE